MRKRAQVGFSAILGTLDIASDRLQTMIAPIAQSVELFAHNQEVPGSIPRHADKLFTFSVPMKTGIKWHIFLQTNHIKWSTPSAHTHKDESNQTQSPFSKVSL